MSRLLNPLRDHNHYNYIITLGALSGDEYNDPNSYRSSGRFSRVLLRSGGGLLDDRVQTFDETNVENPSLNDPRRGFFATEAFVSAGEHAEYYIEDLEIDAVVAPNPNTGISLGTNISFTITEPYSMGKFMEAILIASSELGFQNYIQVPLCLKIEFVGWNEDGSESAVYVQRPVYIPIKLVNIDFNVTGKGSTYNVSAIAYSDQLMDNNTDALKTDIQVEGSTVVDLLQRSPNSLTEIVNQRYEDLENQQIFRGYDRYLILFPENLSQIQEALSGRIREARLSEEISEGARRRIDAGGTRFDDLSIYRTLREFGRSVVNEIGRSVITEEIRDGGQRRHPDAFRTVRPDGLTSPNSSPADRTYHFQQGESIESIIEEVILSSRYATENSDISDESGFRNWFRIKPMVFIEASNPAIEAQIGRRTRTYVYAVYPFRTHEARHLPTSQIPRGIDELKERAQKEYNYIYTGQNEDVFDFQINFNYAFHLAASIDTSRGLSQRGSEVANTGGQPILTVSPERGPAPPVESLEAGQETEEDLPYSAGSSGGAFTPLSNSPRKRIAELFHDRLVNSTVDLIVAEIDIWGDPYFLPTDLSNYSSATNGDGTNLTVDDTMAYIDNEVHIIVNFKTPIDYRDGLDGLIDFPEDNTTTFSGVYQVWAVTNTFIQGQFQQKLKLIRITNQNTDGTTDNTNAVEEL